MIRISAYAHDGGCGKTTSAINLARHLAQRGLSVLCIDMDAKASLTSRIGLASGNVEQVNAGMNIASVMEGKTTIEDAAIVVDDNLFILGTEIPADGTETTLPLVASRIQAKSPNHNRLHRAIRSAEGLFDVCIIDCAPIADVLAVNAIYAADWILSPVRLDEESVTDTKNVMRMVEEIRELTDRKPVIKGLIFTQTNPTTRAYKRTWPEVAKLGVPVLGEIRMFTGVDASKQIFDSYASIAGKIEEQIGGLF